MSTSYTSLIGLEDIKWGNSTFTRQTSTGALITLNEVGGFIDSRSYATLELANSAAYSLGLTLLINKNYTLTANTTLTAHVVCLNGGKFTKASTYTLTINGPFEAGLYQVFSGFAAGNVTFGTGAVKEVYPEWWGVDGTADEVQIQSAIDAYGAYPGQISLTKQNYNIAATITKDSTVAATTVRKGYILKGISPYQTTLTWTGAANGTMINLYGTEFSKFQNFKLEGGDSADYGFKLDYHAYYNEFTSVHVFNCQYGIAIGSVDSTSASENVFKNCGFFETNIGILTSGANSLNNKFISCQVSGQQYAVSLGEGGGFFDGGTYHLFSTFGWGTTPTALFYLSACAPTVEIRNIYCETDNHEFLTTVAGSSANGVILLQGNHIKMGPTYPTYLLEYAFGGPFTAINNTFGRVNANTATMLFAPYNTGQTVTLIGNQFATDTSNTTVSLQTSETWSDLVTLTGNVVFNAMGNKWVSSDNYSYPLPDSFQNYSFISSLAASDPTPSVRYGDTFVTGGTTTLTNFTYGLPGKKITIIAEHAVTITDGTNIFLNGSADFVMAATDTLTLIQKADSKWYEIGRSDNT